MLKGRISYIDELRVYFHHRNNNPVLMLIVPPPSPSHLFLDCFFSGAGGEALGGDCFMVIRVLATSMSAMKGGSVAGIEG